MNPGESLLRVGVPLLIGTGAIQLMAQLALAYTMERLPSPPASSYPRFFMLTHSVAAVLIIMSGHILQVILWAVVYHFQWGEFASFAIAVYFSLANFTTLGANDLALPPEHRLIGALEAAAGMLMFGWSTALLVQVVQRSEGRSS